MLNLSFEHVSKNSFADVNSSLLLCYWNEELEECHQMFRPLDFARQRCFQFNAGTTTSRSGRTSIYAGMNSGLEVLIDVRQKDYLFSNTMAAGIRVI